MPYVSAKYAPPEQIMMIDRNEPKRVVATDENGLEWWLTEDSQIGDWLRYIEAGGTIEPYDAAAAKPAPE
jgi:hypothetical protein